MGHVLLTPGVIHVKDLFHACPLIFLCLSLYTSKPITSTQSKKEIVHYKWDSLDKRGQCYVLRIHFIFKFIYNNLESTLVDTWSPTFLTDLILLSSSFTVPASDNVFKRIIVNAPLGIDDPPKVIGLGHAPCNGQLS